MYFNLFVGLLAICALISQISALPQVTPNDLASRAPLGINCRGSSECSFHGDTNMAKILGYVDGIDENRLYSNGYHIACVNTGSGHGICAFLQNSDHQVSGGVIKDLVSGLVNHNCKNCGSNPVYNYGGSPSNDPQWGILTVNYVSNTDNPCDGLC